MEAATENNYITKERLLKLIKTGRRGRPCAIPKEHAYFLTQGMISGDTMRVTTNKYYRALGLDVIKTYSEEDAALFISGKKTKFCGVLEQIGRAEMAWEKEKITDQELYYIIDTVLELLKAGEPSKEVEQRARNLRTNLPYIRILSALDNEADKAPANTSKTTNNE